MRTHRYLLAIIAGQLLAVSASFAQDLPSGASIPRSQYGPMATAQAQEDT